MRAIESTQILRAILSPMRNQLPAAKILDRLPDFDSVRYF